MKKKEGGNAHKIKDSLPFINCTADCSLIDAGFTGSNYTWCNGRRPRFRVWERLDKALMNHSWSQKYQFRIWSDQAPLFITLEDHQPTQQRYFKFLNL